MVMRLNGFSGTGIDIDDTVSKLMQAARMPQDKLKQQKQTLEWQRDEYRAMNSKIMDFRNAAFNMKLQSSFLSKKASSSDETVLSAISTSTAADGMHTIKVNSLAEAAKVNSGSALSATSDSADLKSLGLTGSTTLTIGGSKGSITINVDEKDTIASLVAQVNAKTNVTGVGLNYDTNMKRFFFTASNTGDAGNFTLQMKGSSSSSNFLKDVFGLSGAAMSSTQAKTYAVSTAFTDGANTLIDSTITTPQKIRVTAGGKTAEITIDKTTTVSKLMDAINSSDIGKAGVSAYIGSDKKLTFFDPSGSTAPLIEDLTTDTTNLASRLSLESPVNVDYSKLSVTGKKADVLIDNIPITYDSNTFSFNGINITAKKAGEVSITTSRDVDTVFNNIKSFVDKYNELITTVNTKMSEKRYKDFQPLTDEQRDVMKEDQIKAWEEKAKSGMLRNDALLTSGLTNFRTSFSKIIEGLPAGAVKSLSEIGISTSLIAGTSVSGSYLDNGKIYLDEDKLKKAITEKPDEVMALFNSNDGISNTDSGDGLATRLYDKANALMETITSKAGATTSPDSTYVMGKSIKDIDTRIDNLTTRLDMLQTRYYKQFTVMETYISQMQAQSSQLTSAFSY